ncbi:helix-turn-helix transcriptional regulator [Fibrivirga algicola]|uniref:Helix-turn-helix transcriptional regulator n=1 Tax=Fibrivirga algicola TaxID=2950420 RepID=A0ABX0QJE7_9BACT|nr:AraC family transcriptional regulator [Fibrivirga algicola]NID10214.1 helix-turn-helix transcriptional regulator [Fibrivirga algicola]
MTYPKKQTELARSAFRRLDATTIPKQHPFLRQLYGLLDKHLDDPSINVDWLAMQLGINRKTLYRQVLRLTGYTPTILIRQYRLQQAINLLQAGHSVIETAEAVGFSTASHFTTVFKKQYGQTPTQFVNTTTVTGS